MVEQESSGLQRPEVESSFKVVEGGNLCGRCQVSLSRENSSPGHLSQEDRASLSLLVTVLSLVMDGEVCVRVRMFARPDVPTTLVLSRRVLTWTAVEGELTNDSSGQPLLMPMVPGSSRRLKSFFWNWKPFTQPLRPTTEDSSGLWTDTHLGRELFLLSLLRSTVSRAEVVDLPGLKNAGGSPSYIDIGERQSGFWILHGLDVALVH